MYNGTLIRERYILPLVPALWDEQTTPRVHASFVAGARNSTTEPSSRAGHNPTRGRSLREVPGNEAWRSFPRFPSRSIPGAFSNKARASIGGAPGDEASPVLILRLFGESRAAAAFWSANDGLCIRVVQRGRRGGVLPFFFNSSLNVKKNYLFERRRWFSTCRNKIDVKCVLAWRQRYWNVNLINFCYIRVNC